MLNLLSLASLVLFVLVAASFAAIEPMLIIDFVQEPEKVARASSVMLLVALPSGAWIFSKVRELWKVVG
jgi:hypothetical protein